MSDIGDEVRPSREADRVFPRPASGDDRPNRRGRSWPHVILGAVASVVLVAVIVLMDMGDTYDENGVRPALASYPEFWVCAGLLVLVQVAVLARAVYVRSRVSMLVALAALAFACWVVWGLAAG